MILWMFCIFSHIARIRAIFLQMRKNVQPGRYSRYDVNMQRYKYAKFGRFKLWLVLYCFGDWIFSVISFYSDNLSQLTKIELINFLSINDLSH